MLISGCLRQNRAEEEAAIRNVKNLTGAPVVVYMARKDEIMSDLNLANEAIFLADLEKIRESQADSLRLLENKSMRLMMPDF